MTDSPGFQVRYARRWGHLNHPQVRALAWLLDSPGLLDPLAPRWRGKVAPDVEPAPAVVAWLNELERQPQALDVALGTRVHTRLGLYAEQLMAFHYAQQGRLHAHGLQVRTDKTDTVGEFDFLLRDGAGLLHIELATKFYLLDEAGGQADVLDDLVGPNLADSLGAKMRKILERQLVLGEHPAARALLPQAVTAAQALVKGWLFYPHGALRRLDGIAAGHCHGFWCDVDELAALEGERFVLLPRLQWLAPYKADAASATLDGGALSAQLAAQFALVPKPMPVLVAAVCEQGGALLETARGFVVPADWRARAAARRGTSA